jgi:hypothetical protein
MSLLDSNGHFQIFYQALEIIFSILANFSQHFPCPRDAEKKLLF